METSLNEAVAKYFDQFAFFGEEPGTTLAPVSTIEMQTGTENRALTARFENDIALRYMERLGWLIMPGGREAVLTEEGSAELARRQEL